MEEKKALILWLLASCFLGSTLVVVLLRSLATTVMSQSLSQSFVLVIPSFQRLPLDPGATQKRTKRETPDTQAD